MRKEIGALCKCELPARRGKRTRKYVAWYKHNLHVSYIAAFITNSKAFALSVHAHTFDHFVMVYVPHSCVQYRHIAYCLTLSVLHISSSVIALFEANIPLCRRILFPFSHYRFSAISHLFRTFAFHFSFFIAHLSGIVVTFLCFSLCYTIIMYFVNGMKRMIFVRNE